jgi:hypothetical protein
MHSKQDGQEVPPYAAETAREIGNLDAGGHGNMASKADARRRGVTPKLAADIDRRAKDRLAGKAQTRKVAELPLGKTQDG